MDLRNFFRWWTNKNCELTDSIMSVEGLASILKETKAKKKNDRHMSQNTSSLEKDEQILELDEDCFFFFC